MMAAVATGLFEYTARFVFGIHHWYLNNGLTFLFQMHNRRLFDQNAIRRLQRLSFVAVQTLLGMRFGPMSLSLRDSRRTRRHHFEHLIQIVLVGNSLVIVMVLFLMLFLGSEGCGSAQLFRWIFWFSGFNRCRFQLVSDKLPQRCDAPAFCAYERLQGPRIACFTVATLLHYRSRFTMRRR